MVAIMMHQTPQDMIEKAQELIISHPAISIPIKLPDWAPVAIGLGVLYFIPKAVKLVVGAGIIYYIIDKRG
jgi:hypothetical protein